MKGRPQRGNPSKSMSHITNILAQGREMSKHTIVLIRARELQKGGKRGTMIELKGLPNIELILVKKLKTSCLLVGM